MKQTAIPQQRTSPSMATGDSQATEATKRLLFEYPSCCDTLHEFERFVKDISSVTNISHELIQEARAAFLSKSPLATRQKSVINVASAKYWLFDIAVLVTITSGLISLCGYDFNSIAKSYIVFHRPIEASGADEASQATWTPPQHNGCPPLSKQMFKVDDIVDVFDPSLGQPFTIPWQIKEIHSNKSDGILRLDLQRFIAGRKSVLVLDNVNAEIIDHIKPFSPNEKAMCELHTSIIPCIVVSLDHPDFPGGGLYSVSFTQHGKDMRTLRPAMNIWRIQHDISGDDYTPPDILQHPLADHK